jgi:hypothetical protein
MMATWAFQFFTIAGGFVAVTVDCVQKSEGIAVVHQSRTQPVSSQKARALSQPFCEMPRWAGRQDAVTYGADAL